MLDISHFVGVTLTKGSVGLIKKCRRTPLCLGGQELQTKCVIRYLNAACVQNTTGFPWSQNSVSLYILLLHAFISCETLIKLRSNITIRRTIVMHGTEGCVQTGKVTVLGQYFHLRSSVSVNYHSSYSRHTLTDIIMEYRKVLDSESVIYTLN
jgi:hypothetical protein